MAGMRFTFVPHPITGTAAEVCRKYLQGNDPITGKPVLQEIIAALTDPLTSEDTKTGFIERPTPRLVKPDTADNLHNLSWKTDGRTASPSCCLQKPVLLKCSRGRAMPLTKS
jgi:hypothetical protein